MPKGTPHPPEVKERALDLIAQDAAANGGTVPFGAFARAAKDVGVAPQRTWDWWQAQGEEEERTRTEEAARVRDEQIQALRETAIEGLAEVFRVGLDLVQQLGDPSRWPEVMNQKTGQVGQIRPLSGMELAAIGRLFREVALVGKDIDDAMREIRIILDSAATGELPDHVEPLPELPEP